MVNHVSPNTLSKHSKWRLTRKWCIWRPPSLERLVHKPRIAFVVLYRFEHRIMEKHSNRRQRPETVSNRWRNDTLHYGPWRRTFRVCGQCLISRVRSVPPQITFDKRSCCRTYLVPFSDGQTRSVIRLIRSFVRYRCDRCWHRPSSVSRPTCAARVVVVLIRPMSSAVIGWWPIGSELDDYRMYAVNIDRR